MSCTSSDHTSAHSVSPVTVVFKSKYFLNDLRWRFQGNGRHWERNLLLSTCSGQHCDTYFWVLSGMQMIFVHFVPSALPTFQNSVNLGYQDTFRNYWICSDRCYNLCCKNKFYFSGKMSVLDGRKWDVFTFTFHSHSKNLQRKQSNPLGFASRWV